MVAKSLSPDQGTLCVKYYVEKDAAAASWAKQEENDDQLAIYRLYMIVVGYLIPLSLRILTYKMGRT